MTKPRTNPDRQLFGIIGSLDNTSEERKWWNARLAAEGIDGFMDHYPTRETQLPERLSEMFHFDRRGYIVGKSLQKAIIPLLDRLDERAEGEGRVEFVANRGGIFTGYCGYDRAEMWTIWLAEGKGSDTIR